MGPYDVKAADETLVEIKASGLLQGWTVKRPSTPSWTFKAVRASKVWSEELGADVPVDPLTRVHVWVFALHTTAEPERYEPLDVTAWEFRVMPHRQLLAKGQVSARLSTFDAWGL